MSRRIAVALCKARHDIMDLDFEVTESIFENTIENPNDFEHLQKVAQDWVESVWEENNEIYIYVTGLSQALTSVLKVINDMPKDIVISFTLMHWDRTHEFYIPQIFV